MEEQRKLPRGIKRPHSSLSISPPPGSSSWRPRITVTRVEMPRMPNDGAGSSRTRSPPPNSERRSRHRMPSIQWGENSGRLTSETTSSRNTPRRQDLVGGVPEVIDLTGDVDVIEQASTRRVEESSRNDSSFGNASRGPRFGHAIIDLADDDDTVEISAPESPDVEFISSRALPRPPRMPPVDNDEVQFVRENIGYVPSQHQQQTRSQPPNPQGERLSWRVSQHFQSLFDTLASSFTFVAPGALDYERAAFNMGYVDTDDDSDYSSVFAPNSHTAPIPQLLTPPKGFTRSMEEAQTEIMVCPNCTRELCDGRIEVQRQIWMVKGCGHIYCGECTTNRSVTKRKKSAIVPVTVKPFKQCVVPGCNVSTIQKNTMIQLYL